MRSILMAPYHFYFKWFTIQEDLAIQNNIVFKEVRLKAYAKRFLKVRAECYTVEKPQNNTLCMQNQLCDENF